MGIQDRDPYEVLGLEPGATRADIRTAYLRLAKKHHPDKNPGDKASEWIFKEVGHAYGILWGPDDTQGSRPRAATREHYEEAQARRERRTHHQAERERRERRERTRRQARPEEHYDGTGRASSKYDAFWRSRLQELRSALKQAVDGQAVEIDVTSLRALGRRNSWSGSVSVRDGAIVSGGAMVHAGSLGRMLIASGYLNDWPATLFRLSITARLRLRVQIQ